MSWTELWRPAPVELEAYLGEFVSDELATRWRLALEDETLVVHRDGVAAPCPLQPIERDLFRLVPGGPESCARLGLAMTHDASGQVDGFTLSAIPDPYEIVRGVRFDRIVRARVDERPPKPSPSCGVDLEQAEANRGGVRHRFSKSAGQLTISRRLFFASRTPEGTVAKRWPSGESSRCRLVAPASRPGCRAESPPTRVEPERTPAVSGRIRRLRAIGSATRGERVLVTSRSASDGRSRCGPLATQQACAVRGAAGVALSASGSSRSRLGP